MSFRFHADYYYQSEYFVRNFNITGHYTTDAASALFTNVFVLEPRTFGLTFAKSF